jgi:hypothetical protein
MAKFDLQRESQREQLKEQRRQYDAQFKRDLAKIALNAGLNLGTGVASDWAGYSLFGGKEKLDAYQRQVAEQEAAGEATRKRHRDIDLVASGKPGILSAFAPQVQDLASQYEELRTDPEAFEVRRRGPGMEGRQDHFGRPARRRGGIEVEKPMPERLDPEGFVEEPDASYDRDITQPREYEELQTLRTLRGRLEEQYEVAARTPTPAGEAKRARLDAKLAEVQSEMNRLMGISDFVSTGGTWRGVHKPPAKPAPPMAGDVFEHNAAMRMREIVDLIPDLEWGAGGVVTGGKYGKTGFKMTPEIWDEIGRVNPAAQERIIRLWNEIAGLDYAKNRYSPINKDRGPLTLSLSTTRQRRGRGGKWLAGDITALVNETGTDFGVWGRTFSEAPGRYVPSPGASARKKTQAFNNAQTAAGHAIDAYRTLTEDYGLTEAELETVYLNAVPTQSELDMMTEAEARQFTVDGVLAQIGDIDENAAIHILKVITNRKITADKLYAAADAAGIAIKGTDIRILSTDSYDARNTIGGAKLQEPYREAASQESLQTEIDQAFDRKVAELENFHTLASLIKTNAYMKSLHRATDKIGPAAFELFNKRVKTDIMKALISPDGTIPHWGHYKDLDETSKAAVGLHLYGLAQQKHEQSTEADNKYEKFANALGMTGGQLRELTGAINTQALATKTELLTPEMQRLMTQVQRIESPTQQMLLQLILSEGIDIPPDVLEELKAMGVNP